MVQEPVSEFRFCDVCGVQIDPDRLEALPDTETCVLHSRVAAVKGYMVVSHKTGSEFVAIRADDHEAIRRADRANRRGR